MPVGLTRSLIEQLTRADIDISARLARVDDDGIKLVYQLQDLTQQGVDLPFLQRGEYVMFDRKSSEVGEHSGLRIQAPADRPIWIEEIGGVDAVSNVGNNTVNVSYWATAIQAVENTTALQAASILAGPSPRSNFLNMTTPDLPPNGGHGNIAANHTVGGFWVNAGAFFYLVGHTANISIEVKIRWKEPRLEE